MRDIKKILLISLIIIILPIISGHTYARSSDEDTVYILMVFSDNYANPINDIRLDYIEEAIEKYHLHYDIEFLDVNRTGNDERLRSIEGYIMVKLESIHHYDIILTFDDVALEFVSSIPEFEESKILFSGISNQEVALSYKDRPNISGYYYELDYLETLGMAIDLKGDYSDIYLLYDNTDKGINRQLTSEKIFSDAGYEVNYINMSEYSGTDYFERLQAISDEDIVILLSNYLDGDGYYYTNYEVFHLLNQSLTVPIYSIDEVGIGEGIIGGKIISLQSEEEEILAVVDQYINQLNVNQFIKPLIGNHYKLDYDELVSYDLRLAYIPKDAELVNKPDFYGEQVTVLTIVLLSIFVIILLITLVGLFYRMNNEKRLAIAAVKSKSEFLAKMSHEVRTPANAIIGYTQLLKKNIERPDEVLRKSMLIEDSSNTLLAIINDILDFSMIEDGKLSIEPKPVEFLTIFDSIANTAEILIGEKDVRFILDIDREIPKYIEMDVKRMDQVFTNLLSNAVKFTQKGEIQLKVKMMLKDEKKVGLKWEIQDTGKGMDVNNMTKIFEAFQQEDNSISRQYGGTGLGLFITKEIITNMGGIIQVESNIGQGTRFVITTSHHIVQEDKTEIIVNHRPLLVTNKNSNERLDDKNIGKYILVAEDNEVNQMLIKEMLEILGLKLMIVRNGLEAVAFTREEYCDIILMDIHMPIMDGVEATDRIREIKAYNHIPIIGLTADVIKEHMDEYKRHGFTTILTKPVYLEELVRALNKYL